MTRYSRDGDQRISVKDIVTGLGDLIDRGASDAVVCDYIDEKFLFGAWDFIFDYAKKPDNPLYGHGVTLMKDIRGLLVAAYEEGRRRGCQSTKANVS